MKRKARWHRKKLVYYPAAGALALSSMLGAKKLTAKANGKDKRAITINLSAQELNRLQNSPLTEIPTLPHERLSVDETLQEAFRHFEMARSKWDHGDFGESGIESDTAYRLLKRLPPRLEEHQEEVRTEIRSGLDRLVVMLNQSNVGTDQKAVAFEPANPMQLEMNARIQREIEIFQTDQRQTFIQGYTLAGAHRPFIEKKLSERGMPPELCWLPLIESGFKTHAQSQVKALGLWQFMPATGKQLGLERDRWIDERMNPEEATDAAVRYLRYLHDTFEGDWNKALAAYNWGEGNVRKAIRRSRNGDVSYWDLASRMPEETRRYVPKFQAAVHIASDPAAYGFADLDIAAQLKPVRYEVVETDKQMDMDVIEKTIGAESKTLRDLNPELLQRITPPQKHVLRVPVGTAEILRARMDTIPEYRPKPRTDPPVLLAKKRSSKSRRSASVQTASAKVRKKSGVSAKARKKHIASSRSRKATSARKSAPKSQTSKSKRPRRRA